MNKKVGTQYGVAWRFSDKQFTPWGGLRVLEELLRQLCWEQGLAAAPFPQPGGNRGIDPMLGKGVFGHYVDGWRSFCAHGLGAI